MIFPTSASFLVSEDCNLACKYCFELSCRNEKSMSIETARNALSFLASNALKQNNGCFHVMLFGGEPMLNYKLIEFVFEEGVRLSDLYSLEFTCSMVTNATIMTKDFEELFKKYGKRVSFTVQLSIDGIKDVHDKNRITTDGSGSFELILKTLPVWVELYDNDFLSLSVHGCSNRFSLPYLYENYLFFREKLKFDYIWFMPIHSEEWIHEDVEIYKKELDKIKNYILNKCKENKNYDEVLFFAPFDRCFQTQRSLAPCGAGKNFVTVTANGEFYPCHQFYFNDPNGHFKIGDLTTGISYWKNKIFEDYDNSDFDCPSSCDAVACYRCIADNFLQNGALFTQGAGGIRCAMSKIEKKFQNDIKAELIELGLFKEHKKKSNDDYIIENKGIKSCNKDGCECKDEDFEEVFSESITYLIKKIDLIEDELSLILKKTLDRGRNE